MTAIATGARHAIATCIKDGQLEFGQVAIRRDFVDSVDIIVHRLLLGETVQIVQVASVVCAAQRTIEAVLAQGSGGK